MKVRTAGEGRADEPREERPDGGPREPEATQVFERTRTVDPEATRVFTRPGPAQGPTPEIIGDLDGLGGTAGPDGARRGDGSAGYADGAGGIGTAAPPGREVPSRPEPEPWGPDGPDGPGDPPDPFDRGRGGGRPPRRRRPRIRLGRIIALLVVAAIAVPPGTWAWVWWTARQDERPPSDTILVLGASQYNGRPSPIFEARLEHAAHLYEEGVAPTIVTVGGNQPGDNYTEGGSGRDWLVEQGVPAESVVAVEEGSNTLRSMEAVSEVAEASGWTSTVIVTDPWHSLRSRIMAEDLGLEAQTSPVRSGPAVIERKTQLWYITRETGSLWYYWIFGDSADADLEIDTGTDAA
ncbi:YdcF family protein [Nocardiopsis sp. RSe5-2]|uniref:YdcF family protein n=1 Tax=Nocardiopsis endophytica TaxID=3018445 RepID=A0ABT4U8M7_9ACTN|nr:YdcF family protein [Nocardiopsis endophytica]MDA2813301.1 YdcF family protein [Nocardiopsis endophytica]